MQEAFLETPVGWLKLVETENVLSVIHFMDEPPKIIPVDINPFLVDCIQQLQQYFDGDLKGFSFMKNALQQGTAFQQRVWNELVNIPFGKTISYRELAIRLGDEKCIRAAASANGQNNLAIAVPCHRVIGTDGSLTGYAGGLWRKKWLLEHEARHSGKASQGSLFE